MSTSPVIPVYLLNNLTEEEVNVTDVFLLDHQIGSPRKSIDIPHRTNYYGIGLCVKGEAVLNVNLETYTIITGCLIAMSPHLIKTWHNKSDDFQTLAILFSKDFIAEGSDGAFNRFNYFENVAKHVFLLSPNQALAVKSTLEMIRDKYQIDHLYRDQVLRGLINSLLFEVASMYNDYQVSFTALQNRSQLLAAEFKRLLNIYSNAERSVSFYAHKLFVTTGHLTTTIKEVTGKTPGVWIAEAVILEARVLLQNPAQSIAQIADLLHFPDQSAFGKYFKKQTSLSPATYRQQL